MQGAVHIGRWNVGCRPPASTLRYFIYPFQGSEGVICRGSEGVDLSGIRRRDRSWIKKGRSVWDQKTSSVFAVLCTFAVLCGPGAFTQSYANTFAAICTFAVLCGPGTFTQSYAKYQQSFAKLAQFVIGMQGIKEIRTGCTG